jgi:hypothetical protein
MSSNTKYSHIHLVAKASLSPMEPWIIQSPGHVLKIGDRLRVVDREKNIWRFGVIRGAERSGPLDVVLKICPDAHDYGDFIPLSPWFLAVPADCFLPSWQKRLWYCVARDVNKSE